MASKSSTRARTVRTPAQKLPRNAWRRRACGIGAKGHGVYDWALTGSAEPDLHYLIRRSLVFRSFLALRWSVDRGDTPVTSGL
jgi:hypothetical protein